jgi:DNA-binding PadR family transcriptional regulator
MIMHPTLPDWLFRPLTPLEFYTLVVIARHSSHCYYIAHFINDNFGPGVKTTPPAVHKALHRMTRRGWIIFDPSIDHTGRGERSYKLTDYGQEQLTAELNRLELILGEGRVYLAAERNSNAHEFTQ